MVVRQDVVIKKFRRYPGRVMFPSSHDFFDTPIVENACFTVLGKLLKSDNQVLITTKPRLNIIKAIDRLFNEYKENLQFRFTITSINNHLIKFWEPNAPDLEERIDSLQFAYSNGYKTSVSIEPCLDRNPIALVNMVPPYVTESIWIGVMNYIPRKNINQDELGQYLNVRGNYSNQNLADIYLSMKDLDKIRWKDSIRKNFVSLNDLEKYLLLIQYIIPNFVLFAAF
jgi:DNA repair photolyase